MVVIFDENASFDHYFGTYPVARNLPGEPPFTALPGTPAVNGLSPALVDDNPNVFDPERLGSRYLHFGCDEDHDYTPEQQAMHGGLMDLFVQFTGTRCEPRRTLDYYDGNTVTDRGTTCQHFALSDNRRMVEAVDAGRAQRDLGPDVTARSRRTAPTRSSTARSSATPTRCTTTGSKPEDVAGMSGGPHLAATRTRWGSTWGSSSRTRSPRRRREHAGADSPSAAPGTTTWAALTT